MSDQRLLHPAQQHYIAVVPGSLLTAWTHISHVLQDPVTWTQRLVNSKQGGNFCVTPQLLLEPQTIIVYFSRPSPVLLQG